jgi:hypothetical protein
METFTGQQKLIARSGIKLVINYCQEHLFLRAAAMYKVSLHCKTFEAYFGGTFGILAIF